MKYVGESAGLGYNRKTSWKESDILPISDLELRYYLVNLS